jgi:transposase
VLNKEQIVISVMAKQIFDVQETIDEVERLLKADKAMSPGLSAAIKMLIMVVKMLTNKIGLNSSNSSKPPSSDQNREKKSRTKSNKAAGGQKGHEGTNLQPVDEPDEIEILSIDRRTLPPGDYKENGFKVRQIFNIHINRHVTEYRAQVLVDQQGKEFVAQFPDEVRCVTQYGASIKANAVYMSMFQLIPYERLQTHFAEMFDIPISTGTLYNFNLDAYRRLMPFLALAKQQLSTHATLVHVDETGVNVNGKRLWLHNASNERWTLIAAHAKRGKIAMDEIGILPNFRGYLVHDHWKPYYKYVDCDHVLCNAHHKRELTCAHEQDGQVWGRKMEDLLDEMNQAVKVAGGCLATSEGNKWRRKYRRILKEADRECPPPQANPNKKARGRVARSKSRNLLERLRDFEDDVLRFVDIEEVPFTNNQGERDLRMSKVHQKISGCFRSMQGAEIFCAVRSYLSTCRKHGVGMGEALECLFNDRWPEFIQELMDELNFTAE